MILRSMTVVARMLAVAVLMLGVAVLVGYGAHSATVIQVMPGLKGMSPLTAIALMGAAAASLAKSFGQSRTGWTIAILTLALGGVLLIAHLVLGDDALSPWVAATVFGYNAASAGKTSIATATCIVLLATATLSPSRPGLRDWLGAAALLISGMAALGYAYGAQDLYALSVFNTMALHTALAVLALSLVSLTLQPEVGWASVVASTEQGGAATRRQLAFIGLPPIAGGVLLRATDAHRLGPGAAMALLVILMVTPLALLILRDGRALNNLGRERQRMSDDLRQQLTAQAEALTRENSERVKAEALVVRAQRLEAVGQLTGGIAHDFNNLLMAIDGNLQLLTKRLAPDHPARRYAENAMLATDRGAKLTGQLLAFSRTQKLNVRPALIDPILFNARQILGSALGPSIEVSMHLGAENGWAATDSDQLELAILNLALNARDAMPDGGSLTVVSGACGHRLSHEANEQPYLSVKVIDTGAGMSAEVAEQAVEPFFTTKERGKGTGLGLAQVYGFVRQCGGDLRIISQPGAGSTIELLLPCVPAPPVATERTPSSMASAPPVQRGDGRMILVIDDDDSVRAVLVETLRTAGFEVMEASNGQEGLERLRANRPAAAIIDFIMPGMNGAEVARIAQRLMPDLPIIFVSGYYDTIALDGISGAVVLRKPFDVDGLNRAVSSALH